MNNTMVREIRGAKINPKSSFKNQGAQNTRGRKLRQQIRYLRHFLAFGKIPAQQLATKHVSFTWLYGSDYTIAYPNVYCKHTRTEYVKNAVKNETAYCQLLKDSQLHKSKPATPLREGSEATIEPATSGNTEIIVLEGKCNPRTNTSSSLHFQQVGEAFLMKIQLSPRVLQLTFQFDSLCRNSDLKFVSDLRFCPCLRLIQRLSRERSI